MEGQGQQLRRVHRRRRSLRNCFRRDGFFFVQAEDGIRDYKVTGVQTCALPIYVAFAVTTYVEEVRIAVKGNSGITGIKDLNGKTIVTTTGTTSVQTLRKNKRADGLTFKEDRKSTRLNSSHLVISYAVFCLKKKKQNR